MKNTKYIVIAMVCLISITVCTPAMAAKGAFWKIANSVKVDQAGFQIEAQPNVSDQGVNVDAEPTDYSKITPIDDYYVTRAVDVRMTNNLKAPVQLSKPVRMVFSFNDIDFKRASKMQTNQSVGHFRVGFWDTADENWIELASQVIWNGSNGVVEAEALNGAGRYALIWSYKADTALSPVFSDNIRVMVDYKIVQSTPGPYVKDDRTMVPLRAIAENLGANVQWNSKENRIDMLRKGNKIQLWIGKTEADRDSQKIPLDVAPEVVDDRTFVPLRFVAEAFGCKVEWDDLTQTAKVFSN